MLNRYQKMFVQTKSNNRIAYIPFVVVGDPSFEQSLKIIDVLIENGADALELGFAFSDPVADGPEIQQANIRVLQNSISVENSFELVRQVRQNYPDLPIGLLVYANLVYAQGIDVFYNKANQVGIDSVLIGDCPERERQTFQPIAQSNGVQSVYIAPPDANNQTLKNIAENSEGYTYLLSRKGVTGTGNTANQSNEKVINLLREYNSSPIVQGFGISTPQHVETAKLAGVNGVITGSAIVKMINKYSSGQYGFEELLEHLAKYVSQISDAL